MASYGDPRSCQTCGVVFTPMYKRVGRSGPRTRLSPFCSRACWKQSLETLESRFWRRVQRSDDSDACWLWVGTISRDTGYGLMWGTTDTVAAHRVSVELATGTAIPKGLYVLHRCDVRACVRPDHLFVGTQADNIRDMDAKGRGNREFPRNHRLTAEQALEVRALRGVLRPTVVAAQYGVTPATVYDIWARRRWVHIGQRTSSLPR